MAIAIQSLYHFKKKEKKEERKKCCDVFVATHVINMVYMYIICRSKVKCQRHIKVTILKNGVNR